MTKSRVLAAVMLVFFVSAAMVSCSDDDDDTTSSYLDGALSFPLDVYIAPNTTVELTATGVTHPDGGEITYIWTVECDDWDDDDDEVCDTVDVFTYTFGDELTSYTVNCSAKADDYYSSTASVTTTTVRGGLDGNGSLTDSLGSALLNLTKVASMIDSREDTVRTYYYTPIGDYDWFIQNLAYRGSETSSPVGVSYYDLDVMADVFGVYYSYDDAVAACPDGWKLPTVEEWDECVSEDSGELMANVYFNGTKMWEFWPVVTISNNSWFSAIPSGQVNLVTNSFTGVTERAVFWTATEDETDSERAVVKYFIDDQNIVYEAYMDKESFGANVRCIRKSKSNIKY